eukprot:1268085-Alexandrium_andersonii.AAC.1
MAWAAAAAGPAACWRPPRSRALQEPSGARSSHPRCPPACPRSAGGASSRPSAPAAAGRRRCRPP